MTGKDQIRTLAESAAAPTDFGELRWLVSAELVPGATQTIGVVQINPGQANPPHFHPNCEEILYVLEGTCRHRLGDEEFDLEPGSVIVIPQGVVHQARCISETPLRTIVSFASGVREAVNVEE